MKIKRAGKFKDEYLTTSFTVNNLLPLTLISPTATFLKVFRLKKLVKDKNKIKRKK